MNEDAPTKKSLLNYSFMAMPLAFAGLPLYVHMPDYYAREFGIGIGVLGTILLVIRMIDAFQDPLIGYASDEMKNRRHQIFHSGVILLVMGMAGLSFGPPLNEIAAAWFGIFMVLATTGFSILTININMLGGFWKKDPRQKVRISSWREALGLLGLLIAAILPALLQNQFSEKISHAVLLFVFACLMIPAYLFFQRFMKEFQKATASPTHKSSFSLFSILGGQDRLFFIICFLSYLSASVPAVLVLFFIRDYLNSEEYAGIFLALYFISGAVFIGIWAKLSRTRGAYIAWVYSMILSIAAFASAAFLYPGDVFVFAIICAVSGIALGADLALPPAIIAVRIRAQDREYDASQYYAALAFLPKIAIAAAAGFSFIALEKAGFQAGKSNSEDALNVLILTYAVVPCVIKAISAVFLWHLIKKEGHHYETFERSFSHGTTRIS